MVPAIIGMGLLQAGMGLAQRQKGLRGIKKAEEMFQKNPYQEDTSISDYYNRTKALASASGLDSVEGRLGQQQIQRNLLTGLRASAGQRGRDVEGIIRGATGATAGLLGRLANIRRQDIGRLGGAAQMKMGEAMKKYKYNVLDPASRMYNLEGQRASEGGQMVSSGLRNIMSGLSSLEGGENEGGSRRSRRSGSSGSNMG